MIIYPDEKTTWSKFGIILTHGAGGDMNNKQLVSMTTALTEYGFIVLRFTCKPPNFQYRLKAYKAVVVSKT